MLFSSLLTFLLPQWKVVNVYNLVWITFGVEWPVVINKSSKEHRRYSRLIFSPSNSYVPELFDIIYMWTGCLSSRKIKIGNKITKMENK